jgi:cytochrome c oxidase subunit 1
MTVQAVQSRSGMSARAAVLAYIVVSGLVLLLMMLLGLTMRLAQAQWINIQPDFFYVIMTMHGAGMVGIAGLSGAAVMWYFVRRYVPVSTAVFVANLVFFLIGAVLILGASFIGAAAMGRVIVGHRPGKRRHPSDRPEQAARSDRRSAIQR